MKLFTKLVISGGSYNVIAALGCLERLKEIQTLDKFVDFVGTSAGSLVCFGVAVGIPFEDIKNIILGTDFEFDPLESLDVLTTYGLSSGKSIDILLDRLFAAKNISQDISFIDFTKFTGKNLVIAVSNITKKRLEYWSVDTVPLMSIKMALRTTCSIPIIFRPVIYNNDMYVDGCIFNNFPINYFSNQSTLKDIFGINIVDNQQTIKNENVGEFVLNILRCMIENVSMLTCKSYDKDHNVIMMRLEHISPLKTINADMSSDLFDKIMKEGYDQTASILRPILEQHE